MAGCEFAVFVVEKCCFGWRQERTCAKGRLLSAFRNFFCKRKRFCFAKKAAFSIHAKPTDRKAFFQHSKISISHRTQTNVQSQISSAKPHCELAVQYPIFETLQSCVCTTVTLSHRFKSSPAIHGKVAVFCAAGYMMMTGHLG